MSYGQEIPLHPWTKLATDIFHFEGASYLIIVDYTGRFSFVCKLSSMTGQHVASQCKLIFSECGWPDWQWTMLHCRNFYKYDERLWCQSHYKLPTPSTIKWIGKKVFPNCQDPVLQGKRRGQRSIQKSNDIPQYSLVEQFTIFTANPAKQDCKIRFPHVKCCKKNNLV